MTDRTYLAEGAKSRGIVTLQRRDRTGAWRRCLELPVPKGSRYSAWVQDNALWLDIEGADAEGDWVQEFGDVALGHYVSISGGRTYVGEEPIIGPAYSRRTATGEVALLVFGQEVQDA